MASIIVLDPIRAIQVLGITSAAILGTMTLTFSFGAIPALLLAPTPLALKQWARMYRFGAKVGANLCFASSISYFYLAYHDYTTYAAHTIVSSPLANRWKGYLLAGSLAFSIIPFTIIPFSIVPFTYATREGSVTPKLEEEYRNVQAHSEKAKARKVMGLKEESDGASMSEASVKQLLASWGTINLGRSFLALAASVTGLWTALA